MSREGNGCMTCGGTHDFATMDILHLPECPRHPDARARALAAAAPLGKPTFIGVDLASGPDMHAEVAGSIGAGKPVASMDLARFHRAEQPSEANPRGALEAAMEWIDDPNTPKPTHIIVLIGRDAEEPGKQGASATRYFQAGAYRHHGQMGLCLEAMHMIRESGG